MDLKSTRDAYGEALLQLGDNSRVVVLDADLSTSTQTNKFGAKYPSRFINVGCAEQNLMGVAAGLAITGKIPFASTYAIFSMRAWEQIRNTIAHDGLSVKIAVSHAGLTNGPDGASHQSLEDIALMRVIPKMSVIVPCDAVEARSAVIFETSRNGPAYIRLNRAKTPVIFDDHYDFKFGEAVQLGQGDDLAIFATGTMVCKALESAELLKKEKINARVVNIHTIKPIDEKAIIKAAQETGAVISVEEHSIFGGLGGAIAEILAEHYPVPMKIIGVRDVFGSSGEYDELLEKFGLTTANIVNSARILVRRKK
ncbi:transketolase family protein [uncultured Methanoregula sp.]|uniref:transketolase family protein n=1 Tax=uncultured Methanoregula sp. TaxID=1005933 RepID=UPI002AAB4C58|nr:transketolase family protein [uncultured Methanoregula sp.]